MTMFHSHCTNIKITVYTHTGKAKTTVFLYYPFFSNIFLYPLTPSFWKGSLK